MTSFPGGLEQVEADLAAEPLHRRVLRVMDAVIRAIPSLRAASRVASMASPRPSPDAVADDDGKAASRPRGPDMRLMARMRGASPPGTGRHAELAS
jgi:hypothetical protein